MAVSTVDEYLSALEKSKLLGSEQLVAAQRLAGESSDAAGLARALARENLVSRWQAGVLLDRGTRAQLRLGKYKLIQRLGKGGMGTVFLAEHVTMNRRVALKIVPRSIAENRASLDRFFAEARAIAALDHPNIVQAYSVDNEMDRYFIVMEYVDGQDLQRMVEVNGPLDFDHAADYIRQAAEGLAHAHARNLVHCDIKPSNLLVNSQGVIKILDLGLARLNRGDEPRGQRRANRHLGPSITWPPSRPWKPRTSTIAPTSIPWAARCIFCSRGIRPFRKARSPSGSSSTRRRNPATFCSSGPTPAGAGGDLQADDGQGAGEPLPIDPGGERGPGALAEWVRRCGRRSCRRWP